jgi:5-formyltetrahydrofolate cyclo-ligase
MAAAAAAPAAPAAKQPSEVQLRKKELRARVLAELRALPRAERDLQSRAVVQRLLESPAFQQSRALCLFASLDFEIDTAPILPAAFAARKRVFLPRIGAKGQMQMLEVLPGEDLAAFPRNKLGIPEPPPLLPPPPNSAGEQPAPARAEAITAADPAVDLVVMPGVAFSPRTPTLVAIALRPQLVDDVPSEAHDFPVDAVLAPL